MKLNLEHMKSSKGNKVANQFIIKNGNEEFFQSYNSIIAKRVKKFHEETIYLETALYKVNSKSLFEERQIQNIIKKSRANIVTVKPEYFVIEKTGWREETEDLYNKLKKYGLLQFVRSGRISVSKSSMEISKHLKNNENE